MICWMKWRWAAGAGVSEDMDGKFRSGAKVQIGASACAKVQKWKSGGVGLQAGEGGVAAEDAEDA